MMTPPHDTPTRCDAIAAGARIAPLMSRSLLLPMIVACIVLVSLGCEQRVVRSGWDDYNPTPGAGRDARPTTAADLDQNANWAIAADVMAGSAHREMAKQRVEDLRRATGLAGFWALDEGTKSTVYYGRYKSPQQPEATKDIEQLRAMKNSGQIRVETLMLLPLPTAALASGELGEFDLRRMAGRAVYSLQIGFYEGGPDARKVAEDAVAALRKQGTEAYYYHGPNRSVVSVGTFGESAIISTTEGQRIQTTYDARVKALQEQFPYNLANGRVIEETRQGTTTRQPSFLVRVPRLN